MEEDRAAQPPPLMLRASDDFTESNREKGGVQLMHSKSGLFTTIGGDRGTSTSKYELRCNLARTAGAWWASVSGLVR
jgi:hypothetical protein